MKYFTLLLLLLFITNILLGQNHRNIGDYEESDIESSKQDKRWEQVSKDINVSWIDTDIRLEKNIPPNMKNSKLWQQTAWRGEKINLQAVIWTKVDIGNVEVSASDLRGVGNNIISSENIRANIVRFVMTDELNKNGQGTCGYRYDHTLYDSSLVADIIDIKRKHIIKEKDVRPVWISIKIPQNVESGKYKGKLEFGNEKLQPLDIEIIVANRTLPEPSKWQFHLDLWQNPYAVARYHNVDLWSEPHFDYMKPIFRMLSEAGQKTITASIIHKPWNAQTYDYFESMIMRVKKLDGTWLFDYSVFDKWVEFMMQQGINKQINCFTMVPWNLSFQYYDLASNNVQKIDAKPGTTEFENFWLPFLIDFAKHLKAKGWFDKTTIAMDERPMDAMQKTIQLIKKAEPDFKISLAGNYHNEIQNDLYDYCIALDNEFPMEVLKERNQLEKISTVYTCCSESYPNTYTFSPPAESVWFGWYAAAKGFGGYLRWAYNSWVEDPLIDSRFTAWGGGDCFFVYPEGRSSIRFEKIIEGIQDFEKIRILKETFVKEKNINKLNKLNNILTKFDVDKIPEKTASTIIKEAKQELNKL